MASRFGITPAEVRLLVGIGTSDISDTDMNTIIEDAEYEAERLLRTEFGNNEYEESKTSRDGSNILMATKTPVNKLVEVQVGGSSVSPKYVKFDRRSGRVVLTDNAEKTEWSDNEEKDNFLRYKYGRLEKTATETTITSNAKAGDTSISVGTAAGFTTNDHVMIIGTGTGETIGHQEIETVTGTAHNTISVNPLQYDHPAGNKVIKMQIPNMEKQLAKTLAGIIAAINRVGGTFKFATSYSIPEKSVTKGVPYPHFEKVLNRLTERQNELLKRLRPEIGIA